MVWRLKPGQPLSGLTHRTDRAGQYAGKQYRKIISIATMLQRKSRAGECYDNAFMKSCFGTFKTELEMRNYDSLKETRQEFRELLQRPETLFWKRLLITIQFRGDSKSLRESAPLKFGAPYDHLATTSRPPHGAVDQRETTLGSVLPRLSQNNILANTICRK